MTPAELLPETRVRVRGLLKEGVIVSRVLESGVPSNRGRSALVDFNGEREQHSHWQLELLARPSCSAPPPVPESAPAPQPTMASQPAPAPASCRPSKKPSWKNDVRVGAIYLNQQPNGKYTLSLVHTHPDGTTTNPVRLVDLELEELEVEMPRAASKLSTFTKTRPA